MTTTVVIPYRGDGGGPRDRAYAHTRAHLARLLPDATIVTADSGHEVFNRAASRNHGVEDAKPGVVVVCDADSLPQHAPLHEAIGAATDGRLHLPYRFFLQLTRAHTERVLADGAPPRAAKPAFTSSYSVGGCLVMDRDAYLSVRQDETFEGWGGEDVAFAWACHALTGVTRHPGHLYGLWHPSDMDQTSPQYAANMARQHRYRAARKDPAAMRALLAGGAV